MNTKTNTDAKSALRLWQLRKIADIIAKSKHVCPVESDI